MKQLQDLLPIRAGDDILKTFTIHRNGRIYSGIRSLQAMSIRQAATYWNQMSGQIWHETRDEEAGRRKARRRKLKPADLVYIDRERVFFNSCTGEFEREPTSVITTRWCFQRNGLPAKLEKAHLLPQDLPLAGGPGNGWYGMHIEGEFTTLVHGPSLANSVFGLQTS